MRSFQHISFEARDDVTVKITFNDGDMRIQCNSGLKQSTVTIDIPNVKELEFRDGRSTRRKVRGDADRAGDVVGGAA